MPRLKLLLIVVLFLPVIFSNGQDAANFTQFFINPYSINPSYAGIEGKSALFLAYRRQWSSIEAAPAFANLSFHAPLKLGLNAGFSINNHTRGVLSNTALMLSLAYALKWDSHKFIRFGISAGGTWNKIDLKKLDGFDSDPALMNALDNNFSLQGNAGMLVHVKSFHFSVALPQLFSPSYVTTETFTITKVKPFESVIMLASNRFYFQDNKHVFEPYILYRLNSTLPSQYEMAGVLHLNHLVWIGGSYRQEFGISALGGIKLKNSLAIGGSYGLKNSGVNELNSSTFEIQLSYLPGNKRKHAEIYSFVSTVKEKEKKIVRKSASEAIAEKHHQDQLAHKKHDVEPAKEIQPEKSSVKKDDLPAPDKTVEVVQVPKPGTDSASSGHLGGPRLKQELVNTDFIVPEHDEHQEIERISRLDKHEDDPTEHHSESLDFHPHYERHELVKKGGHQEELNVGEYVIAGVFKSDLNARHFTVGLIKLGFEVDYGHLSEKNLWYVYILFTDDINLARTERDKYRKMHVFRDAWLLTVHH